MESVEAFDLDALNEGNLGLRLGSPELGVRVEALLARMTLEQKISQMHGDSANPLAEIFPTPGLPELGIPPFRMVDGPRGVRAGIATTFPVAMARGATWDIELEHRIGQAIAREAAAHGANVLLAPAINLLRHPGWGRAQETYGEDPLHVGRLGAAFIAGAQRELVASVKHFALNSIEDTRFDVDVQVDERTLHEVYLPHFELCVRGAHVGTVMSAYNKVNGRYCAENAPLLREILREQWGFRGAVESDWVFGTRSTLASLEAGLDIEMPAPNHYGLTLLEAVRSGQVSQELVDEAVRRILRVKLAFELDRPRQLSRAVIECHEHQELALRAAQESMVLLKNEGGVLPLDPLMGKLAVVGRLAALENTGDHGSSGVKSSFVVSALEGLSDRLGEDKIVPVLDDVLRPGDRARLRGCDAAVVVVGLTWKEEGEKIPLVQGGGDRDTLRLSEAQESLVREVCALCPRTVVVLEAGSALELRSFVDLVPGLLMAWYPGMLGGEALADVLLGEVCPSGKLPVAFARSGADLVPFDHRAHAVRYGYWHGQRHLDRKDCAPEFPFGFGLSYTRFAYEALELDRAELSATDTLCVTVDIANVGERSGAEVVQLYLSCENESPERPLRWLGGFGRVPLAPGERKRLVFRVSARELARYDERLSRFVVDPGWYGLQVGPSSREWLLSARFRVA